MSSYKQPPTHLSMYYLRLRLKRFGDEALHFIIYEHVLIHLLMTQNCAAHIITCEISKSRNDLKSYRRRTEPSYIYAPNTPGESKILTAFCDQKASMRRQCGNRGDNMTQSARVTRGIPTV